MIVPRVEFRPNPDRAVHVQGRFDEELVQRLTPQILLLQHESRDPITVYIDSPGGSVQSMLALLRLLKARSQDYGVPCALITVAMRQTASAAAYLLSAGDYALAYPDSSVLYHGGSLVEEKPLTAARSSFLAQMLRMLNESSAMDLAREIEFRFIFSFIRARGAFADIRLKYRSEEHTV